jgi:hypothetical protein
MGDASVRLLPYGLCELQARTTHGWLCTSGSSPAFSSGDPSPITLARPPPFPGAMKLATRMGTVTRRGDCHLKQAPRAGTSFAGGTEHVTEDRGHRGR